MACFCASEEPPSSHGHRVDHAFFLFFFFFASSKRSLNVSFPRTRREKVPFPSSFFHRSVRQVHRVASFFLPIDKPVLRKSIFPLRARARIYAYTYFPHERRRSAQTGPPPPHDALRRRRASLPPDERRALFLLDGSFFPFLVLLTPGPFLEAPVRSDGEISPSLPFCDSISTALPLDGQSSLREARVFSEAPLFFPESFLATDPSFLRLPFEESVMARHAMFLPDGRSQGAASPFRRTRFSNPSFRFHRTFSNKRTFSPLVPPSKIPPGASRQHFSYKRKIDPSLLF